MLFGFCSWFWLIEEQPKINKITIDSEECLKIRLFRYCTFSIINKGMNK
tara:strand:+ start:614 stop:760 length:147 start_codon:yes stop_codon:yes gene_type:complete